MQIFHVQFFSIGYFVPKVVTKESLLKQVTGCHSRANASLLVRISTQGSTGRIANAKLLGGTEKYGRQYGEDCKCKIVQESYSRSLGLVRSSTQARPHEEDWYYKYKSLQEMYSCRNCTRNVPSLVQTSLAGAD